MFLKILQISVENTCAADPQASTLLKRGSNESDFM